MDEREALRAAIPMIERMLVVNRDTLVELQFLAFLRGHAMTSPVEPSPTVQAYFRRIAEAMVDASCAAFGPAAREALADA